jgi:hypothetical protein
MGNGRKTDNLGKRIINNRVGFFECDKKRALDFFERLKLNKQDMSLPRDEVTH